MSVLLSAVIVFNTDISSVLGAWQRNQTNGSVLQSTTFGVIASREQSNFQNWLMHWSLIIPQASQKIPISPLGRYPGIHPCRHSEGHPPDSKHHHSERLPVKPESGSSPTLKPFSWVSYLLHKLEPIHRYGLKPGDWPKSLCPYWKQNKTTKTRTRK